MPRPDSRSWCSRRRRRASWPLSTRADDLASMAVLVVQPSGAGGSVIPVPVSADASTGKGDERLPIAATVAGGDVESVRAEAEALLGLTLDEVEVVDADAADGDPRAARPARGRAAGRRHRRRRRRHRRGRGPVAGCRRSGGRADGARPGTAGHRPVPGGRSRLGGGRRGDRRRRLRQRNDGDHGGARGRRWLAGRHPRRPGGRLRRRAGVADRARSTLPRTREESTSSCSTRRSWRSCSGRSLPARWRHRTRRCPCASRRRSPTTSWPRRA